MLGSGTLEQGHCPLKLFRTTSAFLLPGTKPVLNRSNNPPPRPPFPAKSFRHISINVETEVRRKSANAVIKSGARGRICPVAEAEELALRLPESERAKLAGKLLASLPPGFDDNDTESKKPHAAAAKWTKT